ncbi:MAG TPA: sigma-54 dependent transcriptional regulator [Alphaproteobacteria bacterium]|nr:sigma-54 dependent transcriptional regulator [Alphaproteobacteria bacterium]
MRVLIIGNMNGELGAASKIAIDKGAKVSVANTIEEALAALRDGRGADLIMMDVCLDIGRLIKQLDAEHIHVPVAACGINADPDQAANAIRAGAKEYIPLPPDAILIAAILEAVSDETHKVIYSDPAMAAVLRMADQIAPSEASILITGESGTGKEVMARYVHRKSKRADMPFISVNCAAIPENLLESELFGHEKGAFTGAVARRIGKFEEASGGTILLDEISEMDVRLQAKLLRALQEREIDRVGGGKPIKVNIRVIATSNVDLLQAVRNGTFREDLLYRLNVVNLSIPPLRARPADILALAKYFVEKYAKANGLSVKLISEASRRLLQVHPWRGNVRELENTIHRALLLCQTKDIEPDAIVLPDGSTQQIYSASASAGGPASRAASAAEDTVRGMVGRTVADVEQDLILNTLNHCLGNRTHAANILGISIRTLRNKLNAYRDTGVQIPNAAGDAMDRISA